MGSTWDSLDDASDAEIEALVGVVMGSGKSLGETLRQAQGKIKPRPKRRIKLSERRSLGHEIEVLNINDDVSVTYVLPMYMVVGLKEVASLDGHGHDDWVLREAVRDYLVKRGRTWYVPRFVKEIEGERLRKDQSSLD